MKIPRHILCTKSPSYTEYVSDESIWILPAGMDWTEGTRSFDLLGITYAIGQIPRDDGGNDHSQYSDSFHSERSSPQGIRNSYVDESLSQFRGSESGSDEEVKAKLIQLLHAMWLVFEYEPETIDQGIIWLGADLAKRCLVVAEIFALLDKKRSLLFGAEMLWQHSLRTGCLAGILAKEEQCDAALIAQSCLSGFSHDIGLAILSVSLDSSRYLDVVAYASQRNLSLSRAELLKLGVSHEIIGAEYLHRRQFPKAIIDAVAFHDEPLMCDTSGLTPTIAVYAANILDGGGWPQDSDGIPSERSIEYLASRGFIDPWPKWQRYVEQLHGQEFRRV